MKHPDHKSNGFKQIERVFKQRHRQSAIKLLTTHHAAVGLLKSEVPLKQVSTETAKLISASAIASALIFSPIKPPATEDFGSSLVVREVAEEVHAAEEQLLFDTIRKTKYKQSLVTQLKKVLPTQINKLAESESEKIARIVYHNFGIKVNSHLDGHELNTDYGQIGYEQHLIRYPGDSIAQHADEKKAGIAPKKGAWGYFAKSSATLTEEDVQKEKYYFAVQTFQSPGWESNMYQMKQWYKHRKMVAINPNTGDVVVGVVADAGPALWTGKSFGGSPEIMKELQLDQGMQFGEVILMFVDDPANKVPLGSLYQ